MIIIFSNLTQETNCQTKGNKRCIFPFYVGIRELIPYYGCYHFGGQERPSCPVETDKNHWYSPESMGHTSDYCKEMCPIHQDIVGILAAKEEANKDEIIEPGWLGAFLKNAMSYRNKLNLLLFQQVRMT